MKFNFFIKILIIFIIPLSIIQPVNADLASDILKAAQEGAKKNKAEYAKWGLTSSKDIKKLKSKEIELLLNGNVLEGIFNDNQNKGKTVEEYNEDGTYRGSVLGKSESAKWYVKEGKLCYKEFNSCAKVYKSKSEPIVYYLKQPKWRKYELERKSLRYWCWVVINNHCPSSGCKCERCSCT